MHVCVCECVCARARAQEEYLCWNPRHNAQSSSLRLESIHWSKAFDIPLALREPRKAYSLSKKGVYLIDDVLDAGGRVLSFVAAASKFGLGMQYRSLWQLIRELLAPFEPVADLDQFDRLADWSLRREQPVRGPLSLAKLFQLIRYIISCCLPLGLQIMQMRFGIFIEVWLGGKSAFILFGDAVFL